MPKSNWDETVIIDRHHLDNFTDGDQSLQRDVLAVFTANAPQYLTTLREATPSSWKGAAHKLKGAARSIGAWQLAHAAERAEHMITPEKGNAAYMKTFSHLQSCLDALLIKIRTEWP